MSYTALTDKIYHTTSARALLIGAFSSGLITATTPAIAQGQQKNDNGAQKPALEEIIVTAQKRAQNLQEVPIAITAISSKTIDNLAADNIRDLAVFTPGLEVSGNTQARFTIRGVNTSDFGVGTDPAVAIYTDGVYSTRSAAALTMFSDIERVEVLKGPQGTLFGRNTAAGAVSIITKQPAMDRLEGAVELRYGRYNKQRYTGMINVPLADTLAVRANLVVNRRDGFVTDSLTGDDYGRENNETGRIRLRWEPSSTTNVTVSYEFDRTNQDDDDVVIGLGNGQVRFSSPRLGDIVAHGQVLPGLAPALGLPITADTPTASLISNVPLSLIYGGLAAFGYDPSNAGSDWDFIRDANTPGGANSLGAVISDMAGGRETRRLDGFALRIEHEFDFASFTSISSFKTFDASNLQEEDGTADPNFYFHTDNVEENEHFYQELRLNSTHGNVTWALGGSFYKESAYQRSDTRATTNSVDTVLYNVGATPGVLAQAGGGFNPLDGIGACESRYLDTWSSFVGFSALPLSCFDPALGALTGALGLPATASLETLAQALTGTSWYGRNWQEDMIGRGKTTSWGIYFDGTWHATDRLNITAGLRYTKDKKRWTWENGQRQIENVAELELQGPVATAFAANGLPTNLADLHAFLMSNVIGGNGDLVFSGVYNYQRPSDSWDYLSPRVVVDYKLSDDVLIYGSWAMGHKAGGHNTQELNSVFDNEEVTNFEAGFKSTLLDGRMRLNMSTWSYTYDDKQSIRLVDVDGSGLPQYITDTQDLKGKGIDFDWQFLATEGLTLFATASYQDISCAANCTTTRGGVTVDTTGQPNGEPDFIASMGFNYDYRLPDNLGTLNLNATHSYTAARTENDACRADSSCGVVTWGNETWRTGRASNYTNARLSWTNNAGNIRLSAYGTNIFNNRYRSGAGGLVTDTMYAPVGKVQLGATYGMDIQFKF